MLLCFCACRSDETLSEQEQLEAALECLVDSIDKFIKDFFDGRLTPTFFSAPPIPEEPEPGPDGTRPSIPVNYGRSISGNQFTEV